MRKDFPKVIVERPRFHSGKYSDNKGQLKSFQKGQLDDFEVEGNRQPMSLGSRFATKELNEHLAPLRRFLRSRVGKPWNAVYSEIREFLKPTSAIQLHVLQHLNEYVCTIAATFCDNTYYDTKGEKIHDMFVVDPRNGQLVENPHSWNRDSSNYRKELKHQKPKLITINGKNYHQYNQIWYEIEVQKFTGSKYFDECHDIGLKRYLNRQECRKEYGSEIFCTSKRQLNGKEIKRLNLREQNN